MLAQAIRFWLCVFSLGFIFSAAAEAKEVTLPYKGLSLNANLELAPGKGVKQGVVLITHGTLAHNGMEMISALQGALKDKGINTLAINLSFGQSNRHGMVDCATTHMHRHTDALDEIGVWLDWLKTQGAKDVILLGHSRGGNQTAWFAVERAAPLVSKVVLLAPATWDAAAAAGAYQKSYNKPLAPVLARAQELVKAGKGLTVLEHTDILYCKDARVSAESFVSYYAPEPRLDTPHLLPKIKQPTLVVVAGSDEVVVGLDRKVAPLADGKRVQMKVVKDADHFFRDLFLDDVVDAIVAFVGKK